MKKRKRSVGVYLLEILLLSSFFLFLFLSLLFYFFFKYSLLQKKIRKFIFNFEKTQKSYKSLSIVLCALFHMVHPWSESTIHQMEKELSDERSSRSQNQNRSFLFCLLFKQIAIKHTLTTQTKKVK